MRDGLLLAVVAITMLIVGLVVGKNAAKCDCNAEISQARSNALQASSKRCGEMMAVLAEVKEHDEKHGYPHR